MVRLWGVREGGCWHRQACVHPEFGTRWRQLTANRRTSRTRYFSTAGSKKAALSAFSLGRHSYMSSSAHSSSPSSTSYSPELTASSGKHPVPSTSAAATIPGSPPLSSSATQLPPSQFASHSHSAPSHINAATLQVLRDCSHRLLNSVPRAPLKDDAGGYVFDCLWIPRRRAPLHTVISHSSRSSQVRHL